MKARRWRKNELLRKDMLAKLMLEDGLSDEEIATAAGISRTTLQQIKKMYGLNTEAIRLKRLIGYRKSRRFTNRRKMNG